MRILLITSIPPIPSWGTAMIFHRHFCERDDFTISVITDNTTISQYKVAYPYLLIKKNKILNRINHTRLYKLSHTWEKLVGTVGVPENILKYAEDFKPDAILTMAGTWTWMAILAGKVSRRLNTPLIGCFYDWWYYNVIYHSKAEKLIDNKFRKFYKHCDLAICISEGMKKALGQHNNAIVLYPIGPVIEHQVSKLNKPAGKVFTIAFTGNLGEWYGKMIESLINSAKGLNIRFKIAGNNPSWTSDFDEYVRRENIYIGQVAIDRLQEEMKEVDGFLLLMGFDKSCAVIESTSFKSKFMDYLYYQKPIMLWAPVYSSAVITAQEFNSAAICTSPVANDFIETIKEVISDPLLQQQLVTNSEKMYLNRFNPDKLHKMLKTSIEALMP